MCVFIFSTGLCMSKQVCHLCVGCDCASCITKLGHASGEERGCSLARYIS